MTDPPRPVETRRLRLLAVCIAVIGISVVSFNLLFLFVPADKSPPQGFAPDIGAAYARTIPLPSITFDARSFTWLSVGLQAAMWAAFIGAVGLLRTLGDGAAGKAATRLVAFGGAFISLALILTPPALSADLYHYALFGRMIITRGLNPYVTAGNALKDDPLWPLADWHEYPTHYGPVFTGLSVLAVAAGGGGPIGTALAFKTMAAVFGALAAWSAAGLAKQQQRSGLLPLGLVALNPLIQIETAGSGHNEMVMMGLALAGLLVAGRGRPTVGFALLIGSVHVKWVTAALVGLFALARLRELDGLSARLRELGKLLVIAVGLTVVLYAPFWAGRDVVGATRRLLGGGSGDGGLAASRWVPFAVIALAATAVVVRRGHRFLLETAALVCLGFVLFVFSWWFPWYLIPALVLLSVGPFVRVNAVLVMFTTTLSLALMGNLAILLPRR